MLPTSNRKELFRTPTAEDKLTLFQLLLDARMLTEDVSLALLKVIHEDLSANPADERGLHKRYAASIAALRYYTADVLQQVADTVPTEIKPIDDVRSTAEYRRAVSGELVRRVIEEACQAQ